MTCVLLWFDTFTVHRHKRSADLSEVKRIPRRVISEYLQLFCGGRCRMIETASIFRARNQRGGGRNRESMSGNQTHQWKEHFRHGGPYLSPPDRQKTTSTCSTFNRHPSWLPKVPIWLVMRPECGASILTAEAELPFHQDNRLFPGCRLSQRKWWQLKEW